MKGVARLFALASRAASGPAVASSAAAQPQVSPGP